MVRDEAGPARAHLSKEGFRVGVYPYPRPAQGGSRNRTRKAAAAGFGLRTICPRKAAWSDL